MRKNIRKTIHQIQVMDNDSDEYRKLYYDKYIQARKSAGIPDGDKLDNFMQYMVDDVVLDFDTRLEEENIDDDEKKE